MVIKRRQEGLKNDCDEQEAQGWKFFFCQKLFLFIAKSCERF
jgi:hypothetical protein